LENLPAKVRGESANSDTAAQLKITCPPPSRNSTELIATRQAGKSKIENSFTFYIPLLYFDKMVLGIY